MSDPVSVLVIHCAETLPDSMNRRKELLTALSHLVKRGHPAFENIAAQLVAIETVEHLQAELPLKFSNPPPKPKGNGG